MTPHAAPTRCSFPGCTVLVRRGRCKAHTDMRPNSSSRGYGAQWQKVRGFVFMRDPICSVDGCGATTTDVDHIVPKADGGTDDVRNLQGLCHSCHSRKTAIQNGGFQR